MSDMVVEWLLGGQQEPGPGHRSESRAKARRKVGLLHTLDGRPPLAWYGKGPAKFVHDGYVVWMPGLPK